MNPHEYLRLQLRLEGKEIINGNLLRQVEVAPGEDMPLNGMKKLSLFVKMNSAAKRGFIQILSIATTDLPSKV